MPTQRESLAHARENSAQTCGLISGWAVDPDAVFRYQVDAAFPLSDHADYDDLLRYVEFVQPRRVFTLHGFAAAFACDLRVARRRGVGVE